MRADDYIQEVQIKKEKIKRIGLPQLLLDEELKKYDSYDRVVLVHHYYNEWDSLEETLALEKKQKEISLMYDKTVEYGEEGAEAGNINESCKKTFASDTENLQLFRLLCKETYNVAHYVYVDETGYDFRCYAKLFQGGVEIRTDVISPLMTAIMLRFTDVPDAFISDAEENYGDLPKRDHPKVIYEKADSDGRKEKTNDLSKKGHNGLPF